ncbi:hypothetical protein FQR65_LT12896 [Abscondita terminalis]|nr:hypothetical protein FQR65_LT12896 [Abscondita terminalis]
MEAKRLTLFKILNLLPANQCKTRWRSIRDPYKKLKKSNKLPTGTAAQKKNKKSYFKRLRFLDMVETERECLLVAVNKFQLYNSSLENDCSGYCMSSDNMLLDEALENTPLFYDDMNHNNICEGDDDKYSTRKPDENVN